LEVFGEVNMLEAKSQLSRLAKKALEGEKMVIASNGEPLVRLVPVAGRGRLRRWGTLRKFAAAVDAAFTPEVDAEVALSLKAGSYRRRPPPPRGETGTMAKRRRRPGR
jgi:prevent-host-death family protein